MRSRPPGLPDDEVAAALRSWWGLDVTAFDYLTVGFGGYHWLADGAWFVSVDDLDAKPWLGSSRDEVYDGLSAALRTAAALRSSGVDLAVAPHGELLHRLTPRYTVAVYPWLTVLPSPLDADDTQRALAALHSAGAPAFTRVDAFAAPGGDALRAALRSLDVPWDAGPFGEDARTALAGRAQVVAASLDRLDATPAPPRSTYVVTHGEPHERNLLATASGPRLVDWDTVGLAPRERDLWWLNAHDAYASATGRPPDPDLLAYYRARWDVTDVASFVIRLRGPHAGDEDDADTLRYLRGTLEEMTP